MQRVSVFRFFLFMFAIVLLYNFATGVITEQKNKVAYLDTTWSSLQNEMDSGNIHSIELQSDGLIKGEFKNPVQNKILFTVEYLPLSAEAADRISQRIREKNPQAEIKTKTIAESQWTFLLITLGGPILLILLFFLMLRPMMGGGGSKRTPFNFANSTAKLLEHDPNRQKITFKDVAGVDEAREELEEIVEFLKNPSKFSALGGKIPEGVLLMGQPGTGKTLLARAIAGEANVPFFSISGSDFVEMFVGVGAGRVRNLFEQARKKAPCIVFIDEIDAVGRHRGAGLGGGHDEREQTLNQLLVEMDGFDGSSGVIIIAATNRPDVLDPALLRPGRFDRRVVVNSPDVKGRDGILRIHARKIPLDENVNLEKIARDTTGFTGADLKNVLNEAALLAARRDKKQVSMSEIEHAKDKVIMGAEKRSLKISGEEKKITAYHEAGHALVALSVPEADPVTKISIVPRGMAMGVTVQTPDGDKHNYSRTYLLSQLKILMGGRCAEETALKDISTGASNDIERATELARRMVCEWGMSPLGTIRFGKESTSPFLGKQISEGLMDFSEQTGKQIDDEVRKLIKDAYESARSILVTGKSKLDSIAAALLEKENLDAEDIKNIMAAKG